MRKSPSTAARLLTDPSAGKMPAARLSLLPRHNHHDRTWRSMPRIRVLDDEHPPGIRNGRTLVDPGRTLRFAADEDFNNDVVRALRASFR